MTIRKVDRHDIFSFSRQGEASSIDENGNIVFYGDNELREIYEEGKRIGALLERPSVNLLHDSFNPMTQSISIDEGEYCFHALGDGDAVISVDGSTYTYTGMPVTFSASSPTTVYIAPEPSLIAFQLEPGQSPSSLIRTPQGASLERNEEVLVHGRDTYFSRNSGTFIGEILTDVEEENAVYFSIEDKNGFKTQIRGRGPEGFVFHMEETNQEIEFINPLSSDGVIKWAIVYSSSEGYIRCYLNEEVGELSLPTYYVPKEVTFANGGDVIPTKVLLDRYEYRPKALTNGEVSRLFSYEFELAYDFEVNPDQVADWADRIFGSSLFGF